MNVEHGKGHVVVDEAKRQCKKKLERNVSSAVASYLKNIIWSPAGVVRGWATGFMPWGCEWV
jgi:hypothetical protein